MDHTATIKDPGGRDQRIARERLILLSQLASEKLSTTRARVAFVLNHYEEARNSDRILFLKYWKTFQPEVLGPSEQLDEDKVLLLENPGSLIRARQKIQNEYGLFLATEDVQEYRRERRYEFQEQQVLDKPDRPVVSIFGDESGKNDEYLIVGSVWALDPRRQSQLIARLVQLKIDRGLSGEFHFNKLSRKSVEHAVAFFSEVVAQSDTLSFKALAIRRKDLQRPVGELTMDLYYQLVRKGIEHEVETGRLTLPRILSVWKDQEEGLDALHLEKVRQELETTLPRHFDNQVSLEMLAAVDSKGNYLIQVADLFTGSLNRVLNGTNETPNHKDEFAHFALERLGIELRSDGSIICHNDSATLMMILPRN